MPFPFDDAPENVADDFNESVIIFYEYLDFASKVADGDDFDIRDTSKNRERISRIIEDLHYLRMTADD